MPTSSTKIVIDAGVGVWALLPVMSSLNVLNTIGEWRQNGVELYAPSLWLVETTSAIRRAVSTNLISIDEGRIALDDMIALDVTIISTTPAHCRAAFNWAARLGQSKAYDSFYISLADELGAVFYTTDQRLVNGAQQKNIAGIKWIGDV